MKNKIKELESQIQHYNELYRAGTPVISDATYDRLLEELRKLDPNNKWFSSIEPAQINNSRKRQLPIPMKSLNKVKNIQDLKSWLKSLGISDKMRVVCMPKFDGVSLLVDEKSLKAYSRGGSENEGQDCSSHYQTMHPHTSDKFDYVFGELMFTVNSWSKIKGTKNKNGDEYKSPRNTAAGLLNSDDCTNPLLEEATFYRYGVDMQTALRYSDFYSMICDICNKYMQPIRATLAYVNELTEEYLSTLYNDWKQFYYIDGIVIYINDISIWEKVGRHKTTGNPLYAIAYKHPSFTETFTTKVNSITWKPSKSGALKPVVNIEAVDTGDCTMENPTGYNASWIKSMNIAPGSVVEVIRSGGVIPKITQCVLPPEGLVPGEQCPAVCPVCGSPTQWNDNQVELCCTNKHCPGVQLAKTIFFFMTCGAENVGEETFVKLYNSGFTTISDILNIQFDDIIQIEGFGESVANTIIQNNNKIKNGVDLETLMQASDCFTGIGKIKAQTLIDEYGAENILNNTVSRPTEVSITHQSFFAGLPAFLEFIKTNNIPAVIRQPQKTSDVLSGEKICFSGFRDKLLEDFIAECSGKVVSSVSKNTTILLVKSLEDNSSKISKAKELGIKIMLADDFIKKYN